MNDDIKFLKELQQELNSQDTDYQASPRFWAVGDYRWVECMDCNAEAYWVNLPSAAESYELESYLKDVEEDQEMDGEKLEEFKEIECNDSALEWIQKYEDEDAYLVPVRKEHFVRENTMFLTKAGAKRHIELNHYHYTKEAHTYAMTAWRSPTIERLWKILYQFDWDSVEVKEKENCEDAQ